MWTGVFSAGCSYPVLILRFIADMVSIWSLCIVEADVILAGSFLSIVSLSFPYASSVLLMCHGRPESRDSVVVPVEQVWSDIDHGGEGWVRVNGQNKRRQTRGQANSATGTRAD